jgi:hypothetical protein
MSWQQLSSLFRSTEFSAAITGAVVGGIITGLFSLFVQWQAAGYQRRRDRETEREAVNRTLQAVATEFDTFRAKFLQALKRDFVEPDPNAPFIHLPKVPPLAQPFFAIFDSNAAVLGLVMDTALRRQIVVTYFTLKSLIDTVNHYVKGREFWEWVGYQSTTGNREIPKEEAELWAKHIRESIPEIETEISALIEAIEKYLKQTA